MPGPSLNRLASLGDQKKNFKLLKEKFKKKLNFEKINAEAMTKAPQAEI